MINYAGVLLWFVSKEEKLEVTDGRTRSQPYENPIAIDEHRQSPTCVLDPSSHEVAVDISGHLPKEVASSAQPITSFPIGL